MCLAFVGDPFDVAGGEKAAEAVVIVDHQEFVDADVFGEEPVSALDRVGGDLAFVDGVDGFAGRHGSRHGDASVSWADDLSW